MKTAKYFSDNVILFLSICVLLSFLLQIFELNTAVNAVYIATLLVVLVCYIASGYFNIITLIICAIMLLSVTLRGFRYDVADYYSHIMISVCTYVCLDVNAYVKLKTSTFKRISYMFFAVSVVLLIAYYFGPLKNAYSNQIGSIDLNLANPNMAGLWLTCIFILLVYSSFQFGLIIKMLYWGAAIGLWPIIIATDSRNCFLATFLFLICIIVVKVFKIKKVPKIILMIIAVLPAIVFVVYMFVIIENIDFWSKLFSVSLLEKGLGARIGIWEIIINDFKDCFWIGNYYKYYNSQMHNSLMTIFCRFGAPVTALSCVSIYRSLRATQDNSSLIATVSLGAILITGCFEASVFVGVAGLYLMILIIPACASVEEKSNSYLKKNRAENY